jgi:hypothetical protein
MQSEHVLDSAPDEQARTYICPICGETIDPGNLGQALYHARIGHKFDQRRRPRTGIAAASLSRAWNATGNHSGS